MLEKNNLQTIEINGQIVQYRLPEGDGPHPVVLLLHGWTGDENTMWIFGSHLPSDALLIAPRAPHTAKQGGFSWRIFERDQPSPTIEDFRPAVNALRVLIAAWPESLPGNFDNLHLVGFSQGAAVAHTFAILHPEHIRAIAGIAGFVPDDAVDFLSVNRLSGKSIFISHGTQDSLIIVERAREAILLLQGAGAAVTYCEADVGHKLSRDCFQSMEVFFREHQ